jgi:hypothetical protein
MNFKMANCLLEAVRQIAFLDEEKRRKFTVI